MKKLKHIAKITTGFTFRSRIEVSIEGNVKVIQMKDLGKDNIVHPKGCIVIEQFNQKHDLKCHHFVLKGDIIFRSRGQTNTAALLNEHSANTIVAAPLYIVRPEKDLVVPEYLLWWINQRTSQAYLSSRSMGTMLKMVSKQSLEELEIHLPSLKQQRIIADIFKLSMQEQQILEKIKVLKEVHSHGILMKLVSVSQFPLNNDDKFSRLFSNSNFGSNLQKNGVNMKKKGKSQHVVPHPDGWAVKKGGSKKNTVIKTTQKEADEVAKRIARNQKVDTKVHGRDGKIRAGNSYGNDPHPPKDKK